MVGAHLACKLTVVYGLSEVRGSAATHCDLHSGYHFSPAVIPELVDAIDHEPVEEGPGLLLLTTLYPFTQGFAVIRYATDDLMARVPGATHGGEPTYTFLSRASQAAFTPELETRYTISCSPVIL